MKFLTEIFFIDRLSPLLKKLCENRLSKSIKYLLDIIDRKYNDQNTVDLKIVLLYSRESLYLPLIELKKESEELFFCCYC